MRKKKNPYDDLIQPKNENPLYILINSDSLKSEIKRNSKQICITVPPELLSKLKEMAQAQGRSLSNMISQILKESVK